MRVTNLFKNIATKTKLKKPLSPEPEQTVAPKQTITVNPKGVISAIIKLIQKFIQFCAYGLLFVVILCIVLIFVSKNISAKGEDVMQLKADEEYLEKSTSVTTRQEQYRLALLKDIKNADEDGKITIQEYSNISTKVAAYKALYPSANQ